VSFQGDKKIVELYKNFGIETRFGKDKVVLCNFHQVSNYFKHDFKDEPDQVQTFVCLAAAHRIKARFSGLQTLFIKETNRVDALQKELKKFNVEMNETTPGFYELQYGDVPDKSIPIRISTYEDHRMAMAFSVWAAAGYCIEIENPEVVSKSYPHYWDDLKRAGFSVKEMN
jgi:3-phosphoshikimate 1-carboxyvinyltransferase